MLAKHVVAVVRRDMAEAIPTTCFEHEVEILKDIHGEGNVEVADTLTDVEPVEIDAGEEMDRLRAYYGQDDSGQPHAERVYGRTAKGLEAHAYVKPKTKAAAAPKTKAAAGEPEVEGQ